MHSHVFFKAFAKSLSDLVCDFWEDPFHNPKLLLAANRLIYLNSQYVYKKFTVPGPLAHHSFLYRITIAGETTSRHLFHEVENVKSFAKAIIICENN